MSAPPTAPATSDAPDASGFVSLLLLNRKAHLTEEQSKRTFYRFFIPEQDEPEVAKATERLMKPMPREDALFFMSKKPELWEKATAVQREMIMHGTTGFVGKLPAHMWRRQPRATDNSGAWPAPVLSYLANAQTAS